jgi:hypothetical protein
MKKILLTIIGFAISLQIVAQSSYTFRILANKGDNKIEKTTGQVVAMRTGGTILAKEVLILSDNSYIGLMHSSGKTIELRSKGRFLASDIERTVKPKKVTVASRYASFISDRMNEPEEGNYRSRMNATGAVSRAAVSNKINVLLLPQVKLIQSEFLISWDNVNIDDVEYTVVIENIMSEVILETTTKSNSLLIDTSIPELQSQLVYIVSVKINNSDISSQRFGIVPENLNSELVAEYNSLKDELDETSPLSKLVLAMYFEQNEFYLDALTLYNEVITEYPDIEDYQILYNNFLNGIF